MTLKCCICNILSCPSLISYTREELLKSEHSTGHTFLPFTIDPGIFLELLVGGAAILYGMFRRRRRGKRASMLVKLRRWGFRTALPSIHLKMSAPWTYRWMNLPPCVYGTWLSEHIQDTGLHLPDFQILWADHVTELLGRGGEVESAFI